MLTVKIRCTTCGQCLALVAAELAGTVTCPRCATTHQVAALVPKETPLPVVVTPNLPATNVSTPPVLPGEAVSVVAAAVASSPQAGQIESLAQPAPIHPALPAASDGARSVLGHVQASSVASAPVQSRMAWDSSPGHGATPRFDPAVFSVSVATAGLGLFARAAQWFDDKLYGWRRFVFTVLALLTGVAYLIGPGLYWLLLVVLATTLYTFLIGRLWSLRDDDGNWTWAYIADRVRASLRGAWTAGLPPLHELLRTSSSWTMTLGLTNLVLAPMEVAVVMTLSSLFGDGLTVDEASTLHAWIFWPSLLLTLISALVYLRWWFRAHLGQSHLRISTKGAQGIGVSRSAAPS